MNKGELVNEVAKVVGSKKAAEDAVNCVLDTISGALKKEDKVTLIGFGTFSVTKRAARTGRNPQTGKEIKIEAKRLPFATKTRSIPRGEQFRPNLPMPKQVEPRRTRISFMKDIQDIRTVAQYLYNDESVDASTVGGKCFDLTLREARK